MGNSLWPRMVTAACVLAAPMIAPAQEVGVYFAAAPKASAPITDADYKPVGFLVTATYYISDSWAGPTAEIGYLGGGVTSERLDSDSGLRTTYALVGFRFRPPDAKQWRVQPSAHFMAGAARLRSQGDEPVLSPRDPEPSVYALSLGLALDFEIAPGKMIGVQWSALTTEHRRVDVLWRLSLGAVFKF